MLRPELITWVEERINASAQTILDKKTLALDDVAHGKLGFYLALRRVLHSKATPQDLGLFDSLNDVLQSLHIVEPDETLFSRNTVSELTDETFEKKAINSNARLVVVEFSDEIKLNKRGEPNASAKMDAVIETFAANGGYAGVRFFRVPIELDKTQDPMKITRNASSAARYDINDAPTTVFLKQGEQKGSQVVGYYLEEELKRSIENALRL